MISLLKERIMFRLRKHPRLKAAAAVPYRAFFVLKEMKQKRAMAAQSLKHLTELADGAQARIWYLCLPVHANLGDQAQALCIEAWLRENYPERPIVKLDSSSFNMRRQELEALLMEKIRPGELIVFQSGYTIKDKHMDGPLHRFALTAFPDNPILFFPQSIRLDHETEREYHRQAFAGHSQVTLLVRDKTSLDRAKLLFPRARLLLFPDIVTTLIGAYHFSGPREGILFCLRNDDEQYFSPTQTARLVQLLRREGSVLRRDTSVPEGRFDRPEQIKARLEQELRQYAACRLVITDRYHGAIFALAAGTPALVLRTADHKVAEGARWLQAAYPQYVSMAATMEEAEEKAREMLKPAQRPPLRPLFQEQYYCGFKALLERDAAFGDKI